MIITAEVTCYLCSRVCGEVEGDLTEPLRISAIYPVGGLCSLSPKAPLRCSRCGGAVYLDDVQRVKVP